MFQRVLVANRGEIALRVIRACRDLGIGVVAVYSTADSVLPWLSLADESVCIGPGPAGESYLKFSGSSLPPRRPTSTPSIRATDSSPKTPTSRRSAASAISNSSARPHDAMRKLGNKNEAQEDRSRGQGAVWSPGAGVG